MRELRIISGVFAGALVIGTLVAASRAGTEQGAVSDELAALTAIRPVPGKNGLYVIPGYDGGTTGGNVAVRVTNDGVILVDNKFPHSFRMISEEVRKVTALPIRYVLDTHHHSDHSGSNADFMAVGEVVAHKNARGNILRNNQPGAPRIVFSEETSVYLGAAEAQAHYFGRGHTNGDAVIYFPDLRTIHTGDLFTNGGYPFIGLSSGGTLDGMIRAANILLGIVGPDTKIMPGHGPLAGLKELKNYHNMLCTIRDRVKEMVDAGKTADEVIQAKPTQEFDASHTGGFLTPEEFTQLAYDSFNRD